MKRPVVNEYYVPSRDIHLKILGAQLRIMRPHHIIGELSEVNLLM